MVAASVSRTLKEGAAIEIVLSVKTNGELVHVSYNEDTQLWIISSSKSVVLARNSGDVAAHKANRKGDPEVKLARTLATLWFKHLETLSDDEISSLKADIANKTLVGEMVCKGEYKDLVEYDKRQFIFHAVVENDSPALCYLPEDADALVTKHKLQFVRTTSLGIFSQWKSLGTALKEAIRRAQEAGISASDEGAVFTFVKRTSDPLTKVKDEVVSLGQVTSLEYLGV